MLIVAGAPEKQKETPTAADAAGRVSALMAQGLSRKDAVKQTAAELGLPKNAVYSAALEEVGQIFGVTRERIRQIENKAIRKLRHPSRAKKIRDFYC